MEAAFLALYLKTLGLLLCVTGLAGSLYCWSGARADEEYYKAARALAKHPGNVLYTTEFKMAEPRHMLLLGGAFASAPLGLVLGSICLGLSALLATPAKSAVGGLDLEK